MVLDRAQRNALYQFIVTDLVGVGDVALALQAGAVAEAQRLRVRFEEDLRLLDLLGWRAEEGRARYELIFSAEALWVCERLRATATELIEESAGELAGDTLQDALRVVAACSMVLGERP
jgi:hypothetical protein